MDIIKAALKLPTGLVAVLGHFNRPRKAVFAVFATAFVMAITAMAHGTGTDSALLLPFAGTLALAVGTGFLTNGARAMRSASSNLGVLMGSLGLLMLSFGVIDIIVTGASDFAKDLGVMVGTGILGYFIDDE